MSLEESKILSFGKDYLNRRIENSSAKPTYIFMPTDSKGNKTKAITKSDEYPQELLAKKLLLVTEHQLWSDR